MADYWDAVVVGAGPAGATTAALLAERGQRVVLLDRARFPRHKACAEYMSPGLIEVLSRLGMGRILSGDVVQPVPGMDIVSPAGAVLRVEYRNEAQRLLAATLPRFLLDSALVRHAQEQGVELVEGFVAKEPLLTASALSGVVGRENGRERTFTGRLTVIADGNRSILARSLGVSRAPVWPMRMGLVAHFAGDSGLPDGFGRMVVGRHGYCGVAPLANRQFNVAVVARMDAMKSSGKSASEFFDDWVQSDSRLRATLASARRVSPVRGVGPIGSRASRVWVPGGLLVGDAAGFFDPFTGEGIHRAVRGAELAAEVAHAALCGDASVAGSLAAYGAKRVAAFRRKQAVTALIQLFVQYPRLMEYALPRLAGRPLPVGALGQVLGDITDAGAFLNPRMLWAALRP